MGQKASISAQEQNQLYNFLGVQQGQKNKVGAELPNAAPVALMRMMAPTDPGQQKNILKKNRPSIKTQHHAQPVGRVRQEPRR